MKLKKHRNNITTENFINWIFKLKGEEEFKFTDPESCPFATFVKSLGYERVLVGSGDVDFGEENMNIPLKSWDILQFALDSRAEKSNYFLSKKHLLIGISKAMENDRNDRIAI